MKTDTNVSTSGVNGKVTITDIARESDVSAATVSLVLRDKPGVSAETRQRVMDTAQMLGYILKTSMQNKDQLGLTNIGLVVKIRPDDIPSANNFYGPVLAGIEAVCRKRQINLLYATMPVDEDNTPIELPRILIEQETDGILLVGAFLDESLSMTFQRFNQPIVLVDAYASNDPYDAIISDNVVGAYQAVKHLINKGHQHIGIVGSHPHSYPSIQSRRDGYCQALTEHGLPTYFADSLLHPDEATQAAVNLLTENPQVTAIFGCNDEVAIAVMQAARELGRKLPQELSVVGFDNIALAQHITPTLTTMRVDKMGMGRLAAQILINRIEFPEAGMVRTIVRPQLIERQSVHPIR